jgi:hypothetical protein
MQALVDRFSQRLIACQYEELLVVDYLPFCVCLLSNS